MSRETTSPRHMLLHNAWPDRPHPSDKRGRSDPTLPSKANDPIDCLLERPRLLQDIGLPIFWLLGDPGWTYKNAVVDVLGVLESIAAGKEASKRVANENHPASFCPLTHIHFGPPLVQAVDKEGLGRLSVLGLVRNPSTQARPEPVQGIDNEFFPQQKRVTPPL